MVYHSFAKPVSFFSAGTLAQLHSSSNFDRIGTGTLSRAPLTSGLLLLATLMITGSPPFGMFFSEMMILKAGFFSTHVAATAIFLSALIVLFCGFVFQIGRLVFGPARDSADPSVTPERFDAGLAITLVAAGIAVVSSFYLPGWVLALIQAATDVVAGAA
jgi:hydrogenase-4 component F